MAVSFVERLRNAARVKQIVGVMIRFGFSHVVEQAEHAQRGFFRRFRRGGETPDPEVARMTEPERLRRMIESLGPTFVKIGQILSTRQDVIPDWAVRELRKLQDQVAPLPFEVVRQQVESELGGSLEGLFSEFAPDAVASASLGQVHRAVLPDGTAVAVKVQRPGLDKQIDRDLSVLADMAEMFEGRLGLVSHLKLTRIVDELATTLRDELVYTIEARNAERMTGLLRPSDPIRIPKVFWDLTTTKVLTAELFEADRLTEVDNLTDQQRKTVAPRLANFVLHQILIHGFFHADPHPGNIFVFPDGSIGVVDWGMVGLLSKSSRDSLGEIFIAIVTQDVERLTNEIVHLGLIDHESDVERFRLDLGRALDRYFFLSRREFPLSQVLHKILELSYEHRIQLPAEIPMLIKVLVTTEGTCMELDPDFDLRAAFEPVVKELVGSRFEPGEMVRDIAKTLRQLNRVASDLPRQTAAILGRVEDGRMTVRVENQGLDKSIQHLSVTTQHLATAVLIAAIMIGGGLVHANSPILGTVLLVLGGLGAGMVMFVSWRHNRH